MVYHSLLKFLFWATANSFSNDSSADSQPNTFSNAVSYTFSNAVSNNISNLISNKLSNSEPYDEPYDESHRGLGIKLFCDRNRVRRMNFGGAVSSTKRATQVMQNDMTTETTSLLQYYQLWRSW